MSSKAMSLKAKIRNYAKDNRIAAQVVLQNYIIVISEICGRSTSGGSHTPGKLNMKIS